MINIVTNGTKYSHHESYASTVNGILIRRNVKSLVFKESSLRIIFSSNPVIFIDIDNNNRLITIIRTILGLPTIGLSVRMIDFVSNANSVKHKVRNVMMKSFYLLSKRRGTYIIANYECFNSLIKTCEGYTRGFYLDFQYYDQERARNNLEQDKIFITLSGDSERKMLSEYRNFLGGDIKKKYVIYDPSRHLECGIYSSSIEIISDYLNENELNDLMNSCKYVSCCFDTNKPSGFHGRAIQMGKVIYVFRESILAELKYEKSILVSSISEIDICANNIDINNEGMCECIYKKREDDTLFKLVTGLCVE